VRGGETAERTTGGRCEETSQVHELAVGLRGRSSSCSRVKKTKSRDEFGVGGRVQHHKKKKQIK